MSVTKAFTILLLVVIQPTTRLQLKTSEVLYTAVKYPTQSGLHSMFLYLELHKCLGWLEALYIKRSPSAGFSIGSADLGYSAFTSKFGIV